MLYNTLNGDHVLTKEIQIINLIKSLLEPENGGVVLIEQSMWSCPEIADFLVICREKFLGDWIDVGLSDKKPVQFIRLLICKQILQNWKKTRSVRWQTTR